MMDNMQCQSPVLVLVLWKSPHQLLGSTSEDTTLYVQPIGKKRSVSPLDSRCSIRLRLSPGAKIRRVQGNTEHVCRNEAELRSPKANEADDYAIDCRDNPPLPAALSHQYGGTDCEHARQVIKPEQHRMPPARLKYSASAVSFL